MLRYTAFRYEQDSDATRPPTRDATQILDRDTHPIRSLRHLPLESESATLAWLKVMAANAARDFCKAKYAAKRGADRMVSSDPDFGNLAQAMGEQQRTEMPVLLREVDAALPA